MSAVESSDIDFDTPAVVPVDGGEALDRVGWHMRMARAVEDELAEVDRAFQHELDRITEWVEHRRAVLGRRLRWHCEPIESFHRMRLAENPGCKTIDTPHGRSRMTVPSKPQVFINDPDTVAVWATGAHPEIVQHRVNVTDLRRVVNVHPVDGNDFQVVDTVTGEVVPGVTARVPAPRWNLDTDPGHPL